MKKKSLVVENQRDSKCSFQKVVINIRNPERLDKFYLQLCEIHKNSFPDWRFGQLCSNFFGWLVSEKKMDLFFPEEDQMITYLKEYCGEENNSGEN